MPNGSHETDWKAEALRLERCLHEEIKRNERYERAMKRIQVQIADLLKGLPHYK